MKRLLILPLLLLVSVNSRASDDLADKLLRMPAAAGTEERAPAPAKQPVDLTGDEPLSILDMARITSHQTITPAVRARVLARLKADPSIILDAYKLLPDDADAAAAAAFAIGQVKETEAKDERLKEVREWIRRRGNFERPQLIAAASAADDKDGWIEGEEDMRALAQLDWNAAAPVLARLAAGRSPRVSALAHVLPYEHAISTADPMAVAQRTVLQTIAEDRTSPARARTLAFETLLASEWKDRDQWYLKMFGDASLLGPTDGMYLLMPLSSPVEKNPDHWIPILARLTTSSDLTVRSNAANLLGDFQLERARADALAPLLPWLKDPGWATETSMTRLRLTQSLPAVHLSAAIPALQWMCEHEEDETIRAYAAMSLVELSAPEAMKYVRVALKNADAGASAEVTQAIVRSHVLSENEIADDIIAFAEIISTPEGAQSFNQRLFSLGKEQKPLPLDVVLGYRLAADPPDSVVVAEKLLGRIQQGDRTSAVLQSIISQMKVPSAQKYLVSQLGRGVIEPFAVRSLLLERAAVAQAAAEELLKAREENSVEAGIAAVISGDESTIRQIMEGDSTEQRKGVLAASRITRRPLDVQQVLKAGRVSKLEGAATAYLEAVNSPAARDALAALHRGEMRIWGERPGEDPGHTTFTFFDEWEATLKKRLSEDDADRIDALAVGSYWGGDHEVVALEFKGEAILAVTGHGDQQQTRPLTPEIAARIRQALAKIDAASLAPLSHEGTSDGAQYEFVTLTLDGGHRVFMNNPARDADGAYSTLVSTLETLAKEQK
ncbi:MAG: hypothetical protein QOK37_2581 [Thermoanaerobaculia bacterium]|jgi:hypothetical protein|nr:hypothetical protein [Thermoanaerobaculia bacterium]